MPYDANTLSNDSIAQMFIQTNSANTTDSTSLSLIQINNDLYATKSQLLNISFNSSYRIDIALKVRKEEFEWALRHEV